MGQEIYPHQLLGRVRNRPVKLAKPQFHSMTGMVADRPAYQRFCRICSRYESCVVEDAGNDDLGELGQGQTGISL